MWKDFMLLDSKRNNKVYSLNAVLIGTILNTVLVWNQNYPQKLTLSKVLVIFVCILVCPMLQYNKIALLQRTRILD